MSIQSILDGINQSVLKTDIPAMQIGDTVSAHVRIVEGQKERIQIFTGVLIARSGRGVNEMVTIRKIVDEEGVERVFPLNSPMVSKYEVARKADARRAKLYFLRERSGKSRRLRDRRRGLKDAAPKAG